jgi:hypothetical protein
MTDSERLNEIIVLLKELVKELISLKAAMLQK